MHEDDTGATASNRLHTIDDIHFIPMHSRHFLDIGYDIVSGGDDSSEKTGDNTNSLTATHTKPFCSDSIDPPALLLVICLFFAFLFYLFDSFFISFVSFVIGTATPDSRLSCVVSSTSGESWRMKEKDGSATGG